MSRSRPGSVPLGKPIVSVAPLLFLCLFLADSTAWSGEPRGKPAWAQGEVLFKLKSHAPFEEIGRIDKDSDADSHEEIAEVGFDTIRRVRSRSRSTEELIQVLMRNPHVAYAEPNFILYAGQTVPNDPSYSQLWPA